MYEPKFTLWKELPPPAERPRVLWFASSYDTDGLQHAHLLHGAPIDRLPYGTRVCTPTMQYADPWYWWRAVVQPAAQCKRCLCLVTMDLFR